MAAAETAITTGAAIAKAMTTVQTVDAIVALPSPTRTVKRPSGPLIVWALNRIRPKGDDCSGKPMCSPSPTCFIATSGGSGAASDRRTTVPSGVITCTATIR